ncbi:hypothetical protein F5Y04DRAFT_284760 [Hypomontagnella monticulosa]|nr:hypothetical protein F5Y04DRAFT_284760 [Hypomontagnella monticulosa]
MRANGTLSYVCGQMPFDLFSVLPILADLTEELQSRALLGRPEFLKTRGFYPPPSRLQETGSSGVVVTTVATAAVAVLAAGTATGATSAGAMLAVGTATEDVLGVENGSRARRRRSGYSIRKCPASPILGGGKAGSLKYPTVSAMSARGRVKGDLEVTQAALDGEEDLGLRVHSRRAVGSFNKYLENC